MAEEGAVGDGHHHQQQQQQEPPGSGGGDMEPAAAAGCGFTSLDQLWRDERSNGGGGAAGRAASVSLPLCHSTPPRNQQQRMLRPQRSFPHDSPSKRLDMLAGE
jgi:hypothetical protein